jgi:hypothetical protein
MVGAPSTATGAATLGGGSDCFRQDDNIIPVAKPNKINLPVILLMKCINALVYDE